MKKRCVKAGAFVGAFAVFAAVMSAFTNVSAVGEMGFTHVFTTNNPDSYAEITIEGNHFTVDGRAVNNPVNKVYILMDSGDISGYEFIVGEDNSFHAEFYAEDSADWSYFRMGSESNLVMSYRIQHDENGWYFPDNGLAELNAAKLDNILTAAPEASSYYISQTADPQEIEDTLAELEGIVQEVCGDEQDDYKKAFMIYRWIAENIYYDEDASNTEVTLDTVAIHNVLQRRRTTCAGFANTCCAMLEIAGIRSVNLKGAAVGHDVTYEMLPTTGENHEFSAFWYEAENRWVYVDSCWGSNGRYKNGEYKYDLPASDKYFDVTDEVFALDHRIDKVEERNYMGALITEEETGEITTEPIEELADTSSENQPPQSSSEEVERSTAPVTTIGANQEDSRDDNSFNIAIYISVGAVGVAILITGIILAVRKKH